MRLIEREQMLVRKYLGARYVLRGRSLETGLDCYGLLVAIYADMGYELFDIEADYPEDWARKGDDHFIENYHLQWERNPTPAFLDVVLFKNSLGVANHGGVVLTVGKFIHCNKAGVTVGRLVDPQWSKRIEGYYRLKGRHDPDR